MAAYAALALPVAHHDAQHHVDAEDRGDHEAQGAERAPVGQQLRARDEQAGEHEAGEDAVGDLLKAVEQDGQLRHVDARLEFAGRQPLRHEIEAVRQRGQEIAALHNELEQLARV